MKQTRMGLRTDGWTDRQTDRHHADRYIPGTYRSGNKKPAKYCLLKILPSALRVNKAYCPINVSL